MAGQHAHDLGRVEPRGVLLQQAQREGLARGAPRRLVGGARTRGVLGLASGRSPEDIEQREEVLLPLAGRLRVGAAVAACRGQVATRVDQLRE